LEIRKLPTTTPALKTLKTLIANIAKAPEEEKYHTIKLSNPKIQERLGSTPQNTILLKSMGFTEENGTLTISADSIDQAAFRQMQKQLEEAVEARSGVLKRVPLEPRNAPVQASRSSISKKPKVSLKVQARRDASEREAKERAQRIQDKEEQLKKIAAQAHARKHDPNWKAGVSAAMAKGGDSISTFRDKFGEGEGG